jgi:hypothetical protein
MRVKRHGPLEFRTFPWGRVVATRRTSFALLFFRRPEGSTRRFNGVHVTTPWWTGGGPR